MRGLFIRIFLFFWLAMTLIGAASAVIYATSVPDWKWERWQYLNRETLRMQARVLAEQHARRGESAAAAVIADLEARSRMRAFLFRGAEIQRAGAPGASSAPPPAVVREVAAEALATRTTVHRVQGATSYFAEPVAAGGVEYVVVGELHRPSPWIRFLSPETLPQRLLAIFLVSGLVCYALARHLTRRIQRLRRASQRLADGDLAVRVGPELAEVDDEVAALGRDLDKMAERIDGLLGAQHRLLRDVSHELRSPLARLNVALELARGKAGEAAAPALDRIEREADRLSALVGEVLGLTQLETQRQELQPGPVALAELLDDVVRDADFEAQAQGRRVELSRSESLAVIGVGEILRRAVENVVRNAVRFTPEGTAVTVALERRAAEGAPAQVAIRVRDHGPGVPDERLGDIFRPFYRVSDSRERASGGTGIGLAITERAVRLHGGQVRAANAAGGGLEVTINLPAAG